MYSFTPSYTDTTHKNANLGDLTYGIEHGRGGRLLTLNNNLLHTPQNAQQQTNVLPELPKWRPRDGRNDDYLKWYDALATFEADFDILVEEHEPTLQELMTYRTAQNAHYISNLFLEAVDEWRSGDAILFDVIKKSLILDGVNLETDLRKVNSFIVNKAKRGRELRTWALSHADLSSLEYQTSLRTKLATTKLIGQVSVIRLEVHSQTLFTTWSHVQGNNPTEPSSLATFYMQLLASFPIPTEQGNTAGTPTASVRKWLADKIVDDSPDLAKADELIKKMCKYATTIGMHPGKINDEGDIVMALHKESMCDFCDARMCRSRLYGGPERCISRYNSTFDLERSKAPEGQKDYVKSLRAYHKANPTITTLKGVKPKQGSDAGQVTAIISNDTGAKMSCISDETIKRILGPELAAEITDMEEFKSFLDANGIELGDGAVMAIHDRDEICQPALLDGNIELSDDIEPNVVMMIGEWAAPSPSVMPDTPKPRDSPLRGWRTLSRTKMAVDTVKGGAQDKTPINDDPPAAQVNEGGGTILLPSPIKFSTLSNQIVPLVKGHVKSFSEFLTSRGKHELITFIASLVALPRLAPKSTAKMIALLQSLTAWGSQHTVGILKRAKTIVSALIALTITRARRLTIA